MEEKKKKEEKKDKRKQTRFGILTDEELKIAEILSSDQPRLGYEMLKQLTCGSIARILDKTVFMGVSYSKDKPDSLPNHSCRFLVFNSLFRLDLSHCTFSPNHLSVNELWRTIRPGTDWETRMPDKEGVLQWYIYDYDKKFCSKLGITSFSEPV